jgi:hypothetical protein
MRFSAIIKLSAPREDKVDHAGVVICTLEEHRIAKRVRHFPDGQSALDNHDEERLMITVGLPPPNIMRGSTETV